MRFSKMLQFCHRICLGERTPQHGYVGVTKPSIWLQLCRVWGAKTGDVLCSSAGPSKVPPPSPACSDAARSSHQGCARRPDLPHFSPASLTNNRVPTSTWSHHQQVTLLKPQGEKRQNWTRASPQKTQEQDDDATSRTNWPPWVKTGS